MGGRWTVDGGRWTVDGGRKRRAGEQFCVPRERLAISN